MREENFENREFNAISEEIKQIKKRINYIEASLELHKMKMSRLINSADDKDDEDFDLVLSPKSNESIEFTIGEYGMAWLGNIVLLFGISFLVQYLQNSGHQIISVIIGFGSVAGIYLGSYFTRTSYSYLSKLFAYNGHILLFYIAVRLHFIHSDALIKNDFLGVLVLFITVSVLFYLAYRRISQTMSGMVLLMILVSGIISNSPQLMSASSFIVAFLTMLLYYKRGWLKLVFIFIFLVYLCHLNWLLNNPLHGQIPAFIESPGSAYIFIIASGFAFSLLALIPKKDNSSNDFIITSIVWNGLGFSSILILVSVIYLKANYVPVYSVIAFVCIAYSIILQKFSFLKITASMYALYGFLAMSVAFYGILFLPKVYMLFAVQSLLVVTMALWFRSRFIVVMNTILFVILLFFYLTDETSLNSINFSFMLVAFVTARIINWKKERLNIKTEFIRNLYLVAGLLMTLIAIYKAVPPSYITVTWIFAAILFFLISRLINNVKYRWLAIGMIVISGIKLIFVDMSDIDIGFRVLVFMLLAIISLTVSILYTKYLIKKNE